MPTDRPYTMEVFHKEGSSAQYEFVLGYTDALQAVEFYHLARQDIKKYFQINYDYNDPKRVLRKVCYLPKISEEEMGNGLHMHMSLWRNGVNVFGDKASQYSVSKAG